MAAPAKQHILIVTFPAFGHIVPMLELAKKIGQFHDVSFAISAGKVSELTKRELALPTDPIQVVPVEDGIVDDFDNPTDPSAMQRIFAAVMPATAKFLAEIPLKNDVSLGTSVVGKPVDVVIVDGGMAATTAVCVKRGVPYYLFHCANCSMLRVFLAFGEDTIMVSDAEAETFMRLPEEGQPLRIPESMKGFIKPMQDGMMAASAHIVNSARVLEEESLRIIEKSPLMAGKSFYCVGPLVPEEKPSKSNVHQATEKNVADWLDRQETGSVVYVSFGSVATPPPEQLKVLATALVALKRPVIWSIRDKYLPSLPEETTSKIPGQFNDPKNQFVVVHWAPQKLILEHKATAVFLSHCGWNSTLESFSGGTPIVAWPMFADQLINAEWAVKLGAALLIPGTGVKAARIVPAEEIEEAVNKVGGWTAGKPVKSTYTEAVKKWADQLRVAWLPGGGSYNEFFSLIKFAHGK